uniref:Uncharacterized protein n=1 Tax=Glossina austeni TaxID=7395 RepID=A0A1A9UX05_GLOAU
MFRPSSLGRDSSKEFRINVVQCGGHHVLLGNLMAGRSSTPSTPVLDEEDEDDGVSVGCRESESSEDGMGPGREQEQVSTRFHVNNCSEAATQLAMLREEIIYEISETREPICRAARSIVLILADEYERTLWRLERAHRQITTTTNRDCKSAWLSEQKPTEQHNWPKETANCYVKIWPVSPESRRYDQPE